MSEAITASLLLHHRVEQFYYREARLLDERRFRDWLELLDPSMEFVMPSRHVPMPDRQGANKEPSLSVERELGWRGPAAAPIRLESHAILAARVERNYLPTAWTDNPPARTRRLISNVEVERQEGGRLRALSNFHLFYSHGAADNHHYIGCRRDLLKDRGDDFRIASREVILDWNVVTAPTVGLFF